MSWSCPFHSFQLPLHVPVIFSVCPLHFPCMSRSFVASQFPTSPVVPIGCLVLCFPFILPALPLCSFLSLACPFQFPFVSLSFPVAFLSCRLPISSPHFLALPCMSPVLPSIARKKHGFSRVFAKRTSKNTEFFQIFGKRRKSRQGDSSLGPLFGEITARYVGNPPPPPVPYVSDVGRGGGGVGGGGYPLSCLACPTRRAMSADLFVWVKNPFPGLVEKGPSLGCMLVDRSSTRKQQLVGRVGSAQNLCC